MSSEDNEAKRWLREILNAASADFVSRCLGSDPRLIGIADWEIQWLRHAADQNWISIQGSLIHVPPEKKYSIFTFNREYITHLAAYAEIRASCAPNERIEIEFRHLDLVVFTNEQARIGVEIKKSHGEAENLVKKMLAMLPAPRLSAPDRGNDPLRKIKCLFEIRPEQFWVICPGYRWKFRVNYVEGGLELIALQDDEASEKIAA